MADKKRMLSPSGQKVLKPIHSLSAKVFGIGLIALLALLIGRLGNNGVSRQAGDMVLLSIMRYGVNLGLLGAVATGLVYALYTPWGFFRHRWIIVKWVGCAVMLAILIAGLAPTINSMTTMGEWGLAPSLFADEYKTVFRQGVIYCSIEVVLMITLSVVSVFKPWRQWEGGKEAR